jgi:hypothetical protein
MNDAVRNPQRKENHPPRRGTMGDLSSLNKYPSLGPDSKGLFYWPGFNSKVSYITLIGVICISFPNPK